MPSFNDHHSNNIIKALVCGDSGGGKTGLLATLANGGYNVRILDFDNGLDVLGAYLTDEGKKRVFYETFKINDKTAPDRAFDMIKKWKTSSEDLGDVSKTTSKDVIVLDSLSFYGQACIRAVCAMNGKDYDKVASFDRSYWGTAMKGCERVISYLTSTEVPFNVIINTHVKFQENDQGVMKAYPNVIGSALAPIIGRYFNNIWRIDVKGDKRMIRTTSDSYMALKSSKPTVLKPEEEFDLAKLFDKILG